MIKIAVIRGLILCTMLFMTATCLSEAQAAMDPRWSKGGFKGFNLGKAIGSSIQPSDFDILHDLGVSLVRINLRVVRCFNCPGYVVVERDQAYADLVVSNANRVHIAVVVTIEIQPSGKQSDYWENSIAKEGVAEIWRQLSRRYKGNAAVVAFDLLNEPVEPEGVSTAENIWVDWAAFWVRAIREIDPDRTVVFEPSPWGLPKGYQKLQPMPFENIVYSFHFYEPHQITHQGLPGHSSNEMFYPNDSFNPTERLDRDRLNSILSPVKVFSSRYHVPVYVGEFSCIRWAPGQTRLHYAQDVLSLIEPLGWSWTFHSFKEYQGWDPEIEEGTKKVGSRSLSTPLLQLLTNHMHMLQPNAH